MLCSPVSHWYKKKQRKRRFRKQNWYKIFTTNPPPPPFPLKTLRFLKSVTILTNSKIFFIDIPDAKTRNIFTSKFLHNFKSDNPDKTLRFFHIFQWQNQKNLQGGGVTAQVCIYSSQERGVCWRSRNRKKLPFKKVYPRGLLQPPATPSISAASFIIMITCKYFT